MPEVEIRTVTDIETLRRVEVLQMEIWGMPPREVVPAHQLKAATGAGGAVIVAVDAAGDLVGFCYGFAGWRQRRPLFYSHMAGVRGGRQLQDIGFALKRAQREAALAMGYDHAVWTYDPLQSVNARFNLHKLGATARRYYRNYYGEMPDELNQGTDSDRIEVDWALRSRRVEAAVGGRPAERDWQEAPRVLEALPWTEGPAPSDPVLHAGAPTVRIEIPTDFPQIRQRDRGLARAWRVATREAFQTYFGRGYTAVDFALTRGERLRGDYVLSREPHED
ncbi:MAG: GNAT family N-acetyltransferase [Armatimonadota bacterium]|nr:GNAT family N-acetyltransferase [Armatimonadota bacterium]MDR7452872.1 GNAT family N-acetyltransferase [Armatimonadota bacterium]MDR7456182.1 GNAT family N-acetyltransferase [Armatimonadota bacterium]MDR7496392.1 GNAT family N-acetyltransferase [Armatimonadota bacterium]MDR7510650.1 GNAT family N-acetyltransferase [Armatimonadota bacterium]